MSVAPKRLLLLAALALPALAAADTATEALRARDAEIRAALPPEGAELTPEARARLEAIVKRTVDLRGMLQAAVGPEWKKATEAQRKRLVGAFEKAFSQISGNQLDRYRSTEVAYGAEVEAADGVVHVPTKVDVLGESTEVAYAMQRQKDAWRIVDVIVEGSSTVEAYQASFAKTIGTEGLEGLIRRLEKRGAPRRAAGTTPAAARPATK
jgi:phospholipid transport system substrate-binding protein